MGDAGHGSNSHGPEGTVNADMPTGEIEVLGREVNVLNTADTPPFQLDEHAKVGEEVRLH